MAVGVRSCTLLPMAAWLLPDRLCPLALASRRLNAFCVWGRRAPHHGIVHITDCSKSCTSAPVVCVPGMMCCCGECGEGCGGEEITTHVSHLPHRQHHSSSATSSHTGFPNRCEPWWGAIGSSHDGPVTSHISLGGSGSLLFCFCASYHSNNWVVIGLAGPTTVTTLSPSWQDDSPTHHSLTMVLHRCTLSWVLGRRPFSHLVLFWATTQGHIIKPASLEESHKGSPQVDWEMTYHHPISASAISSLLGPA